MFQPAKLDRRQVKVNSVASRVTMKKDAGRVAWAETSFVLLPVLVEFGVAHPREYNVIDHAQTVANFMDALKIKKTNFVGHHLGSIVAAEFEIKWPERVNKMILSGIGYKPEPSEGKAFEDPPNFMGAVELKKDGSHLMEWWRRTTLWGDYSPEILEGKSY